MFRRLFWLGAIGGAIGIPILFSSDGLSPWKSASVPSPDAMGGAGSDWDAQAGWLQTQDPRYAASQYELAPPLFPTVFDFREVFRFDIDPHWVTSRWDRVSSCPGDGDLTGMRVALVTGTQHSDLHGSMTYYFDQRQFLRRIVFRGWTSDATRLIQLVSGQFKFQSRNSLAAGLYVRNQVGQPTGLLVLDHPPVIRRDSGQQLMVYLEINDPLSTYTISYLAAELLKTRQ